MNRTLKTYCKQHAVNEKDKGTTVNVTLAGKITTRPTKNQITIYKENRKLKHIILYKQGTKGRYNEKTKILDTPANQLTGKQMKWVVTEQSFYLDKNGGLGMRAVLPE